MNQLIKEAIVNKKCLSIFYAGYYRVIEPHAYGESKNGNELMRAYQIGGGSNRGGIPDWRLFRVDEISGLKTLNEAAQTPRKDYKRDDKAMEIIFCQV